jgi:polyisoprenoid-binding protein YceI
MDISPLRLASIALALLLASACGSSAPRAIQADGFKPAPAPSEPVRRYRVIAGASRVSAVASATVGSYTLRIPRVVGHIDWVPRQPERSRFVVEADMRSVVGSVGAVTRIVRDDFLHVERFPKASFASHSIAQSEPGKGRVIGTLLLHGVSRSIEVPGSIRFRGDRLFIETEFVIDRREYAIESDGMLDSLVSDDVVVRLLLVAARERVAKPPTH